MSVLCFFFGVCPKVLLLLGVLWLPCAACAQLAVLGFSSGVSFLAVRFGFPYLVGVFCPLDVTCAYVAVLLVLVGVLLLASDLIVAWVVFVSCSASYCLVVPGSLEVRVLASQFFGSGQLYCMHFVRLCPSPGVGVPTLWLWLLLVCLSMLSNMGFCSVPFSFFFPLCDLRGSSFTMLTVTVPSLDAGALLVVWSCGHHFSFFSPSSH